MRHQAELRELGVVLSLRLPHLVSRAADSPPEPPPLHCTRDGRVACLQGDALWAPRLRQTCQSVGASIYDPIKIGIYLIFAKIDRSLLD